MRHMLKIAVFSALLLPALPALGATTSSAPPVHTNVVPAASPMKVPVHPINVCGPAAGPGNVVEMTGLPSFRAQSVQFESAVVNPGTMAGYGGGGGAGKVSHGEFSIVKTTDAASPKLFQALTHNTTIPNVKITMRKAGGDPNAYMVLTMSNVFVSSISHPNGQGSATVSETVVLRYQTISKCSPQPAASGKK